MALPNLSICGLCAALLLGCSDDGPSAPPASRHQNETFDAGSVQGTPTGGTGGNAGTPPTSPPANAAGADMAGANAEGASANAAGAGANAAGTSANSAGTGANPASADAAGQAAPEPESPPDAGISEDAAMMPTPPDPTEPSAVYGRMFVYAGGWDWESTSYPFGSFELDLVTGAWSLVADPIDLGPNPSYIAKSPDQRTLYVTNERDDDLGGLTVARVEANGAVTPLGHQPPVDGGLVFASLDAANQFVLASSYNGASASVFPVQSDGALGAPVATMHFPEGAKSHSIIARGDFAWVANLGVDSIAQLGFDPTSGQLADNSAGAAFADHPDSGPRTIAAPPDAASPYLYVSHEFGSSISVMRVSEAGVLSEQQTLSTLPADFVGENTGSHVQVHPNGRFLYASNRGHDSIAVFAIAADGSLSLLQHSSTRGQTPRHFDIDVSGQWLIVANQASGTLAAFRIGEDGRLEPFGQLLTGLLEPTTVAAIRR